jgi:hypothetical protein
LELLGRVGFESVRIKERFDCFEGTSKEAVARRYSVRGANVYAIRR